MSFNILLYSVCGPLIGGALCLLFPDRLKIIPKILAFLITLASVAVSIIIFLKKPLYWPEAVSSIFLADNLAAFIGIGLSLFAFLIAIYSFGFVQKDIGKYFGYYLMTLGGSLGAAFANNLITLLGFWGFLAMTLYLLVNLKGTDESAASAKKAMIIVGGTDAIMVLGVGLIWAMTGTFFMDKICVPINSALSLAAYISIAIAGFAKAGAMPFHSWLPDVAQDGPASVTAYLPASLDKLLGIYLLARLSLDLFVMNAVTKTILLLVGSVTIVFAVIFALVQHDFKRLLGYHAVSQVGYMILGIGTGNAVGIAGGLFHMLNNAVYKSCLFLTGGSVESKTGTTELDKLGGLAKYMPVTFACFLIASLSISGIPPFNGFVSKWMIYQGIIESGAAGKNSLWVMWLACAMFGSALTLASFMKLLHAIFLGRPSGPDREVKEAGFLASLPVVILALVCIVFGLFAFALPIPLFIAPSVKLQIIYNGAWNPLIATILILIGIAAGLCIYALRKPGGFRTTATFVGGEEASKMERVSGTEFYDTIKEMKWLGKIYKKEEEKRLDIYEKGARGTFYVSGVLRWLHNGVLPTYMIWCLIGMMALFFILIR